MATLSVALVWNHHQPYYKNLLANTMMLPWVRLHGAKDYFAMASILKRYPKIKATFNLTPCLLEQFEDYQTGMADTYLGVMGNPKYLSPAQKGFLIEHFFETNWDNKVIPNKRYNHLLSKRQRVIGKSLEAKVSAFSEDDLLDLQVLFNLVWLDQEIIDENKHLKKLLNQTSFSLKDKQLIIAVQRQRLASIVPIYQELHRLNRIELITSPYFHPILPLVGRLSKKDALWHLKSALSSFSKCFSCHPEGIWLPELAIDQTSLELLAQEKILWTITDEDILAKSLNITIQRDSEGNVIDPQVLYKPYFVPFGNRKIGLVFRDHVLSDLIGFSYNKMPYRKAVADLMQRLRIIYNRLKDQNGDFLVTIALDGENPWNDYSEDKEGFLNCLYSELSSSDFLKTTTPGDFLKGCYPPSLLHNVSEGSWVNGNFGRWIGSPGKNKVWKYLAETKGYLNTKRTISENSLLSYFAAQGSDYTWWLDSMPPELSSPFEKMLRVHLSNVYLANGDKPPKVLQSPITLTGQQKYTFYGPINMVPYANDD